MLPPGRYVSVRWQDTESRKEGTEGKVARGENVGQVQTDISPGLAVVLLTC